MAERPTASVVAPLLGAVALAVALTGCSTAQDDVGDAAPQPTTAASPATAGYLLPEGETVPTPLGVSGSVEMRLGDLIVVHLAAGTDPGHDTTVVVLAEQTVQGAVFQAVGEGETTLVTGPAPPPACPDGSCAGQPDPPHIDIIVAP